jgi:hypothetical protein
LLYRHFFSYLFSKLKDCLIQKSQNLNCLRYSCQASTEAKAIIIAQAEHLSFLDCHLGFQKPEVINATARQVFPKKFTHNYLTLYCKFELKSIANVDL